MGSNDKGCDKDLQVQTQFSRSEDDDLGDLDFLSKGYKYPKTIKSKSIAFENYKTWKEETDMNRFNMTWLDPNTPSYEQYIVHSGSATAEQIASDFAKINDYLQTSTKKVFPKKAIIGISGASASLVVVIGIVVALWMYINKLSKQKEETPKETIYTMVREAPQSLQRVKRSISTRFTRGTK